ncbi:MAG: chain length determinant family protein [Rhodospirillales bacterium]|nr:chain length determinant family protein [Rhodospirillales bacterium]MCB9996425.1 chain length determinant family protein [Rhodospirillales bacterium]
MSVSGMQAVPAEPTLADLLGDLWQARKSLLAGALIGMIAAVIFMMVCVPHYRATMLIAPAERKAGPDIKALLPDNSSFAVQYMLNSLGSADSGDYVRFEHTLREGSVAAAMMMQPDMMAGIARDRRFIFQSESAPETAEDLAGYLFDKIAVEPVGTTALRRIVYKHPDRAFAVRMLQDLHFIADGMIRQEVRDRTASRETYLEKALESTSHPDHRRALTALLMEQEHVRMILAMDEPFAAIIAEPPSAGTHPYWPRAAIIFPAFVLAGMMLGFALFKMRDAAKS